jgi:hypothetical protein
MESNDKKEKKDVKKLSKWRKRQNKKYRKKINLKPLLFLLFAVIIASVAFYVHKSGLLNQVFVPKSVEKSDAGFDASEFVKVKPLPQIDFEDLEN